jgi:2-amino-4-hydroxy-6-hydroxymethyldihydropteridine diphosphokinase
VLLVGDQVVNDSDLIIPHPRMWERAFVLVPLRDLAPELARDLVPELDPDIGGDSVTGVRPAGPLG